MSILSWLASLLGFLKKATPEIRKVVKVVNTITDALKDVDPDIDEPLDVVLSVIPEHLQEKFLGNVVPTLFHAGLITSQDMTPLAAIRAAAEVIKSYKGTKIKKNYLNSFTILLNDVMSDGEIGWDDLIKVGKAVFDHKDEPDVVQALDDEEPPAPPSDPVKPRDP